MSMLFNFLFGSLLVLFEHPYTDFHINMGFCTRSMEVLTLIHGHNYFSFYNQYDLTSFTAHIFVAGLYYEINLT